ncbi:MAG: transcriptional regulator, partial [Actinomycetota bacterium]|nr:transcriptional regulator [Actinomycetota bacterium]
AQRMGIKQAAVSGLEAREDLLLSTLANYLAAAGATDVTITARLGERIVEVALPPGS